MSYSSTTEFIAFLRNEAAHAEEAARRLRAQAAHLAATAGLDVRDELAPLDEHGRPKYTGKKRGRKPKPKKRHRKPGTPKRKHTGYTLYMKEHYPAVKVALCESSKDIQSKDVVSTVATSWKTLSDTEREAWKGRAKALVEADDGDDAMPVDDLQGDIDTADIDGEGAEEEV